MDDNFRDSIGTINEEGKRSWIFPKKPSGRYYSYRKWVSYVLLLFLVLSPFIKTNGNQFLMFNVLERRFNIFGFPFWPQDFHLFVISLQFLFTKLLEALFDSLEAGGDAVLEYILALFLVEIDRQGSAVGR